MIYGPHIFERFALTATGERELRYQVRLADDLTEAEATHLVRLIQRCYQDGLDLTPIAPSSPRAVAALPDTSRPTPGTAGIV